MPVSPALGSTRRSHTADFLTNLNKTDRSAQFAAYIRNKTTRAVRIDVPFGALEKEPRMTGSPSPSAIETAKLNDVDPEAWMTNVIDRMQSIQSIASTSWRHGIGHLKNHRLAPPDQPRAVMATHLHKAHWRFKIARQANIVYEAEIGGHLGISVNPSWRKLISRQGEGAMRRALIASAFVLCSSAAFSTPDDYHWKKGPASSPPPSLQERQEILQSNVLSNFTTTFLQAATPSELKKIAGEAKKIHAHAPVQKGDTAENYDVVIQIGHYPRTHGKTGGQGKLVSEQQMAALIGTKMYQDLLTKQVNEKPIKALLIAADNYNKPLKTKMFVALHTDASARGCTLGPSVGYRNDGEATGMHLMAVALALTLGVKAEKFMKDNYTVDLHHYYAINTMKAILFRGVLEMSELTCEEQENLLLERSATLSQNLSTAVQIALNKSAH